MMKDPLWSYLEMGIDCEGRSAQFIECAFPLHSQSNSTEVIVMFDSRASTNDCFPESPILLSMECDIMTNNDESSLNHKLTSRPN